MTSRTSPRRGNGRGEDSQDGKSGVELQSRSLLVIVPGGTRGSGATQRRIMSGSDPDTMEQEINGYKTRVVGYVSVSLCRGRPVPDAGGPE